MQKGIVPRFVLSQPLATDANELARWVAENFDPIRENREKIADNKTVIAGAVCTMFHHNAAHVIAKYNATRLVAVVKAWDWNALPEALESFDPTWS